jgi:hypothetical protein
VVGFTASPRGKVLGKPVKRELLLLLLLLLRLLLLLPPLLLLLLLLLPKTDAEQNIARDKLREELQIMWLVRLLHMSERQRLPKLTENNKLLNLKKEINGIIEEVLKEDETDITDVNH